MSSLHFVAHTRADVSSKEEWELVQVHVRWDITNFRSVDGDLVSQHARGWDLDRISPIVVVVAKSVREIQDRILRDVRVVFGHIEVGWLHCTLSDGMRHQEEIESAINNFRLLDEAVVNVSSLRRIGDSITSTLVVATPTHVLLGWVSFLASELEESLSDSFVDNDKSGLGQFTLILFRLVVVLLLHDLVKLLKFVLDHLRPHRIADTISVDEDVVGKLAIVVVSKGLESVVEVLLKDRG